MDEEKTYILRKINKPQEFVYLVDEEKYEWSDFPKNAKRFTLQEARDIVLIYERKGIEGLEVRDERSI